MWGRPHDRKRRRIGETRAIEPLRALGDVQDLVWVGPRSDQETDPPSGTEPPSDPGPDRSTQSRQAQLGRIAEAAGVEDLWTFAMVEDDLFLRDCVGAVPGSAELAAVLDALEAGGGVPARGLTRSRRILVFPPRTEAGPALAVAFDRDRAGPDDHELEILACLGEALAVAETVDSAPEAPADATFAQGRELPPALRRRIDSLAAEWIRDALERCVGDRAEAARILGVPEEGLERWMERLGIPTRGRGGGSRPS